MPVANCFRHSPCKKTCRGNLDFRSLRGGGFAQRARSRMISMHFLRRSVKSSSFMALQTDRPMGEGWAGAQLGRAKGLMQMPSDRRTPSSISFGSGRKFLWCARGIVFRRVEFSVAAFQKSCSLFGLRSTINNEGIAYKGQIIQIALQSCNACAWYMVINTIYTNHPCP